VRPKAAQAGLGKAALSAVEIVLAWHEALNSHDVDRLIELSSRDVEVGGPRGASRGRKALREWVDRAQIHLVVRSTREVGDGMVVAEEDASWHLQAGSDRSTAPMRVASVFLVADGRVASVTRWDSLDAALASVDATRQDGTAEPEDG
jgi:hypothetical protein